MKAYRKLSVYVLAALMALSGSARLFAADRLAGPIPAQVVRVVDGDTLVVRAHIWLGQEVETLVRLMGTDTPEMKGRCESEREKAVAAREFLVARVDGRTVQLQEVLTDKYGGRVRAQVLDASGADLSQELIRAGLARHYDGGQRQSWCGEE